MKKNLTVGMPLAVPTQKRPPDKYASHPYPVFVDEYLVNNLSFGGIGKTQAVNRDDVAINTYFYGVGELTPITKYHLQPKEDMAIIMAYFEGSGALKSIVVSHSQPLDDMFTVSNSFGGIGKMKQLAIRHKQVLEDNLMVDLKFNGIGLLK